MSQFSQSFYISDNSFLKLQNQAQTNAATPTRSLQQRSKTDVACAKDTSLDSDIVDESPTSAGHQQSTMRERLMATTQTRRRVLRRNKSALAKTSSPRKTQNVSKENVVNENIPLSVDLSALLNSDFKLNVTDSAPQEPVAENEFNVSDYFKDDISLTDQGHVPKANISKYDTETENEMDKAICEDEVNFTLSQDEPRTDSASFIGDTTLRPAQNFLETELKKCKAKVKNMLSGDLDTSIGMNNSLLDITPVPVNVSLVNKTRPLQPKPQFSQNPPLVLDTSKNLRLISNWGLPRTVLQEYTNKGIVEMFEWQSECLQNTKVLFENANLVYSAPTSSGKTLVSEILMIKNTLERRKKALFILPFVSVVREKTFYLQDLLVSSGIRVDGFYGGYQPPGGFEKTDIAVCTIEKANSIVNRLLEHKLDDLGVIVVDEVHLISDPGRGYILELLLTKVLYMCRKFELKIQIITMSATLPNLELLKGWLHAEFYITDYRPVELKEMIKIGDGVFDSQMQPVRRVTNLNCGERLPMDQDHVGQLCLETILEGCGVIVFCPSKEWCEKLCLHVAELIYTLLKGTSEFAGQLREKIPSEAIEEAKVQLQNCPTGLDAVLAKTISYGCAYHHAGLTTDERDIIESSFRNGALRVIVATSTLSSGVNLPARRVIIRTPLFGGRIMSSLTYRQMIGRAGRKGQDTLGESVLICSEAQAKFGRELIGARLAPITSSLDSSSGTNLKRAVLEIIASGIASTKADLESFVKCTLLCAEKGCTYEFFQSDAPPTSNQQKTSTESTDPIASCMDFLIEYEFIRLQPNEITNEMQYVATRLGQACLASSMPPGDGFFLFSELQKSRQCFVLESELHAIYLVTPYSVCSQIKEVDWLAFLDLWEKLPSSMRRVGELVGVRDAFLVRAMRGNSKLDYKVLQVHKRFYIALALQELVNEASICEVADKYKCNRGLLQSLQQTASTFAGIVSAFCTALSWHLLALIVSQFKERLFFGIHRDLMDLMRIPSLSSQRARALFQKDIKTLVDLANADVLAVENILHNALSFDTGKQRENENEYDANKRLVARNFYVTGKHGLTVRDASQLLIDEARVFLAAELGVQDVQWAQPEPVKAIEAPPPVAAESEDLFKLTPSAGKRKSKSPAKHNSPPKRRSSPRISANKSIEEVINSQSQPINCDEPNKTRSRLMTQHNRLTRSRVRSGKKTRRKTVNEQSQSIEISGEAGNMSIFHHSILMNIEPPVLTPDSSNSDALSKLNIVDLCKNRLMFDSFFENLTQVTQLSVSVGIAQATATQENRIGGNLLKTQKPEHLPDDQPLYGLGNGCFVDGIAFCFDPNTVYYLNMQSSGTDPAIGVGDKVKKVATLFESADKTWQMYDAKEQLKFLVKVLGSAFVDTLPGKVFQDPQVAHWLLNPDAEISIGSLAQQYAPEFVLLLDYVGQIKYGSLAMQFKSQHSARHRASIEACVVRHILAEQLQHLQQIGKGYILKAFTDLEMPIQVMLCKMEIVGVSVDRTLLADLSHEITTLMKNLEQKIFQLNGKRFNLSSPAEVGKVLGIHRNLASRSRPSTSKQVLEKIETPMAGLIIQYRKLEATMSKTLAPISRAQSGDKIFGRSFCFTSTGRISMHEPNLQNVAKDFNVQLMPGAESKFISFRSVFKPPEGRCLISVDFCQLELRILTHLSQDRKLMQVMADSTEDIFRAIAASWHKIEEQEVDDELRNQTKQICYGIIYGMGMKSLADALKIDESAATTLAERFHTSYPAIRQYTDRIVKFAAEHGYVETLIGRRRYLAKIRSDNSTDRAQAERQAVNTTIQGSAADISKNAILRVERNLKKYQKELKINTAPTNRVDFVLQLHDELIYELPVEKTRRVAKILKHSMENCVQLSIPLRVKIRSGPSWGDLVELKL